MQRKMNIKGVNWEHLKYPFVFILLIVLIVYLLFFPPICLYFNENMEPSDILTIILAMVAIIALFFQNLHFKRNIQIKKLEELFVLIQKIALNYDRFRELYNEIENWRDKDIVDKKVKTLSQYYQIRDNYFSKEQMNQIITDIYKISMLSKAYTSKRLSLEIVGFVNLMESLSDLVFNGGSLLYEISWKKGYPEYNEFREFITELEDKIINKINSKAFINSRNLEQKARIHIQKKFNS